MGNAFEAQHEAEEEVKERMMMMEKLLQNKMEAVQYQLEQNVNQDTHLPIVAIVQRVQKMSLSVTHAASDQVSGAVDDIFGGRWLHGLKNLVTAGLNMVLGNAAAGEKENTGFCIVYSDNSLLRVDYYLYKYDLSSEGAVKDMTNGFLYFVQIGVLDLEKVNPQIMLYELTKSVGEDDFAEMTEELKRVEAFAKELYGTIREMKKAVLPDTEVKQGEEEPTQAENASE